MSTPDSGARCPELVTNSIRHGGLTAEDEIEVTIEPGDPIRDLQPAERGDLKLKPPGRHRTRRPPRRATEHRGLHVSGQRAGAVTFPVNRRLIARAPRAGPAPTGWDDAADCRAVL